MISRINNALVLPAALAATLGLSGCARPSVAIDTPITQAELAPYKKAGQATIEGSASIRGQDGKVSTCAGQQVVLAPAVAHNRETVAAIRAGQQPVAAPNVGSSHRYWRKAACDARGRFRFHNVPAALWFVSIPVHWPDEPKQGALLQEVRVPPAGTVRVQLTERDVVR